MSIIIKITQVNDTTQEIIDVRELVITDDQPIIESNSNVQDVLTQQTESENKMADEETVQEVAPDVAPATTDSETVAETTTDETPVAPGPTPEEQAELDRQAAAQTPVEEIKESE